MVGRSSQGLPIQAYLHFSPCGSVQPIHKGSNKAGRMILREEVIKGWREKPALFSIQRAKRHRALHLHSEMPSF